MQPRSAPRTDHGLQLEAAIRAMRARYDKLDRGQIAQLRRCRSASKLELEGAYWKIAGDFAKSHRNLSQHIVHVVLLFPYVTQGGGKTFSMGRFLRAQLGDGEGANLRLRRVLSCESRDELDHRLRALLRLTAASGGRVDWGVLGRDILWFFAESDGTRRRWAQDFYAPIKRESATSSDHAPNA